MRYNEYANLTRRHFSWQAVAAALNAKPTADESLSSTDEAIELATKGVLALLEHAFMAGAYGVTPEVVRAIWESMSFEHVLILERNGVAVCPEFLFLRDGEGRLYYNGVVERLNEVLEAHDDPWGAYDWWTRPHPGLQDNEAFSANTPVELLKSYSGGDASSSDFAHDVLLDLIHGESKQV